MGLGRRFLFPVSAAESYAIDFLVVAAGGGGARAVGGAHSGGGGAGGLKSSVTNSGGGTSALTAISGVVGDVLTITVAGATAMETSGNDSSISSGGANFTTISCSGGGRGAGVDAVGNGGCGGGSITTSGAGTGISGQGFAGGISDGTGTYRGGGGGGTGATGTTTSPFGRGGIGTISAILSTTNATAQSVGEVSGGNVYYGSGGGAYDMIDNSPNNPALGGGGVLHGSPARNALPNSGGGGAAGDGNYRTQVLGASGVVILRVPTASYSGTVGGSPTVLTEGTDKVIIFKSSGSYTV